MGPAVTSPDLGANNGGGGLGAPDVGATGARGGEACGSRGEVEAPGSGDRMDDGDGVGGGRAGLGAQSLAATMAPWGSGCEAMAKERRAPGAGCGVLCGCVCARGGGRKQRRRGIEGGARRGRDRCAGLSWRREGKNEREKGVGLGFRLGSGLREALGQMGLAGHKWRLGFSLPPLSFH